MHAAETINPIQGEKQAQSAADAAYATVATVRTLPWDHQVNHGAARADSATARDEVAADGTA